VGLAEELSLISVKAGAPYSLSTDEGKVLLNGKALDQLWVEMRGNKLIIEDQAGRVFASSAVPVVLSYQDAGVTTIVSGFGGAARTYRGSIEFRPRPEGITLVNSLNIEEYLYGVIPAEMPASWPREALKAQAIAARAYTLAYLGQYRERGFDLYGSVMSAAYQGVSGESAMTTAAVDATRGMILVAGGEPLKAYYSANHGGYSEDSLSVWGTNTSMAAVPDKLLPRRNSGLPLEDLVIWLRERPRSYSSIEGLHSAQAYRWEKWVAAEEIVARNAGEARLGTLLQVLSRGRGISGRINKVELRGTLGNHRVMEDRIRSRLGGLRSNLFTIRSKLGKDGTPEYFIFQGAGWGHGVGMDQTGAAGMAQAGFTAAQILKHYYPLAELVSR
jgi:SpoIID/LytB domain protein